MSKKQFLVESIRDFKTTGAWIPSQKFLIEDITKLVNKDKKMLIVEFGSGEGCVTKKIVEKMSKDSNLLAFELNKNMASIMKKHFSKEKRIKIVQDNVINSHNYIKHKKADLVISSIPLGNLNKKEVFSILHSAKSILNKEGIFVQYQYLGWDMLKLKKTFNNLKINWIPLNFPPAFVYTCKKTE